jgi:hypothetical protein
VSMCMRLDSRQGRQSGAVCVCQFGEIPKLWRAVKIVWPYS